MSIVSSISEERDRWIAKGLTPSTLKVGPDIQDKIREEFVQGLPSTLLDMRVIPITDPGFFVTGPWNYVPVNK